VKEATVADLESAVTSFRSRLKEERGLSKKTSVLPVSHHGDCESNC